MTYTSYGESLLRQYLEIMVPDLERIYNYRPAWLMGLEIDIYFPQAKVGVEFNGDQHYVPTETFGDPGAQRYRDREKWHLCKKNGVILRVVTAIDLEYTRLNAVRNAIHEAAHKHSGFPSKRERKILKTLEPSEAKRKQAQRNRRKLQSLNKLAVEYRKTLIEKYDSPTARIKGKGPRKEAYKKAWEKATP